MNVKSQERGGAEVPQAGAGTGTEPIRVCSIACLPLSSVEGPATHVRELHEKLERHPVDIDLFLPDLGLPPKTAIESVTIHRIRVPNIPVLRYLLFDALVFLRLFFRFLRRRPDVVYMRQSYSTLLPGVAAKLFRLPLVVEINGIFPWDLTSRGASLPIRAFSRLAEHVSYRAADRIICVTEGIKRILDEQFPVSSTTVVIRNGVDPERLRVLDRAESRRAVGLPEDGLLVGYVGCFTPWDGVGRLADCASRVRERYSNVRFVLVGDGHCATEVRARIEELGLTGLFVFPGFVAMPELNRYLSSLDVAVAPYIPENNAMGRSSLKCLEYLSCGLPTVVADIPETRWIEECGAGRLFRTDDDEDLLRVLLEILDDESVREEMGRRGRDEVVRSCQWQHTADRTFEEIASLVKTET